MAELLRNFIISFLKSFVTNWLADFFILVGLTWIVFTTYKINVIAGNYLLGSVVLLIGFLLAKSK